MGFLTERKRALLALPPGAGKTAIVSRALGESALGRSLIVATNGPVLQHWQAELWRWGKIPSYRGTGSLRHRALVRGYVDHEEQELPVAVVVNYETFRRDIDELVTVDWQTVVFDESHRLKNRQSQTFKAAKRLKSEHLYLVSGTPVLNRAEELWTSLHLMDPKRYRGYWGWAEKFFEIKFPRYQRRIVRAVGAIKSPQHAAILRTQLAERMYFRPLEEILPDLPPVTETVYEVTLSAEEQKAHDSMLTNFWMEVGDDIVQAPNAITKMTRLRQLASDWSVFGEAPGTKAQAVAQLVDDLGGEQCIVFCAFRATVDALVEMLLKAGHVTYGYHGGYDANCRSIAIGAFQRGSAQVLVATIATLGEGVDGLQVAHNAVMVDRAWTPAANEQAIARLRRQGQKSSVNVIHLVAAGTVDEVVNDALREKRSVVEAVMGTRPSKEGT